MRGRDTSRRRWIVAGLLFTALLAVAALVRMSPSDGTGVDVGERAPAFSAPNLSGEEVSFADHRGEVVLVNVWATWCGPCRVEMPSIQASYERFRERGFTVLAVSVDTGLGYEHKVEKFVAEYELTFPVLLDPEGRIQRTLRTVGVPETFVLDREGRIVKRLIGATDWDSEAHQTLIEELLRM